MSLMLLTALAACGKGHTASNLSAHLNDLDADHPECGAVDLSPKTAPVRNQGPAGDCYAYAATELLNFGVKSKSKWISASATAVEYNTYLKEHAPPNPAKLSPEQTQDILVNDVGGMVGGTAATAIKAVNELGACSEMSFPSEKGDIEAYNLRNLKNSYDDWKKDSGCSTDLTDPCNQKHITSIMTQFKDIYASTLFSIKNEKARAAYSTAIGDENQPDSYLGKGIAALKISAGFDDFLQQFLNKVCIKSTAPLPTWVSTFQSTKIKADDPEAVQAAASDFDAILNQGYPIAMSFKTTGLIKTGDQLQEHSNHAAVIMGRKYMANTPNGKTGCFYLVKNSWGINWHIPLNVHLDAFTEDSHPGYFWAEKTDLQKYVYEYVKTTPQP